jgi:hypothetical protein
MQGRGGIFPKVVDPPPYDDDADYTGIAFVNIEEEEATVDLTVYDDSGVPIAPPRTVTLPGHGKEVKVVGDLFSDDTDLSAATYIRYSSDRELIGFQMNGSMDGMLLDGLEALKVDPVTVHIDLPEYGSTFDMGETIVFAGRGYDATGDLVKDLIYVPAMPPNFLLPYTWTSSIDGEIGTVHSFEGTLSEGTHVITLTVTDPDTGEEMIAAKRRITVGDCGCGSAE